MAYTAVRSLLPVLQSMKLSTHHRFRFTVHTKPEMLVINAASAVTICESNTIMGHLRRGWAIFRACRTEVFADASRRALVSRIT